MLLDRWMASSTQLVKRSSPRLVAHTETPTINASHGVLTKALPEPSHMTDHLRPQDAALERLRALHQLKIDLSLDRMERLCAILKKPQCRLPPVIHVAGTNGKICPQ